MKPTADGLFTEYRAMADLLISMLRPVLALEPTRETIQTCLEDTISRMVKVAISNHEGERTLASPIYAIVLKSYLDVVMNNPMYGSHALVMQWDVAIDKRMKEFFKRLENQRSTSERSTSTNNPIP